MASVIHTPNIAQVNKIQDKKPIEKKKETIKPMIYNDNYTFQSEPEDNIGIKPKDNVDIVKLLVGPTN